MNPSTEIGVREPELEACLMAHGARPRGSDPGIRAALSRALFLLVLLVTGCAAHHQPRGVPVESRPTPPQPEEKPSGSIAPAPALPPVVHDSYDRVARLSRAVADTTAAGEAVRRCAGRKLLAEEEGTRDATIAKLAEARAALLADDIVHAQTLAREARLLSSSLSCR